MKKLSKVAAIAMMATAITSAQVSVNAQSRSGSSSHTSSQSRSSSSSSMRSQPAHQGGSVSRGSGSANSYNSRPSAAPQTRSSSSQVRSSGSQVRQTSPQTRPSGSQARPASPQTRPSGSQARPASPQARPSGSQARPASPQARPSGVHQGNPGNRSVTTSRQRYTGASDRNRQLRSEYKAAQIRRDQARIAPRHRDYIEHGRAAHFYGHNPHYYGYRIHTLPPHYTCHVHWGHNYYICDGIYYRHWGGCYHICRPPYGIFFERALYNLELTACRIAYYNTVYRTYNVIDQNYNTIQEQNRIIAENNATINAQNEMLANMNERRSNRSYELASSLGLVQNYADAKIQYFYDDGIFFVQSANGQYETIVPPAGALISELPDDYEVVNINGEEYYRVDDTVYRMTVSEGKPFFEVLGQMPASMYARYADMDA